MTIFKTYDIRGIYDRDLSDKEAYLIGYYLAKYLNFDSIKIAKDIRNSGNDLCKFLIQGLIDAEVEVVFLGNMSTPCFYFSLFEGINSGIMITASHNPKEYNGFKIISDFKSFDGRNGLFELEKLVNEDLDNKLLEFEQIKDSIKSYAIEDFFLDKDIHRESMRQEYVKFLKNFYEMKLSEEERNILKEISFAVDFSSGMSSIGNVPFFENEGLKVQLLNQNPDGNFPNHSPDPFSAKEFVKANVASGNFFTCVFDGDGDRIIFYDENKDLILNDYIIASYVDFFSDNFKKFVCDLRVSKILKDISFEKNINVDFIRVGRAFYQDFLVKNSTYFGAELSGHYFFREFHNYDNPDIALIYMLKIVAMNLLVDKNFKFSNLILKYKRYYKIEETNVKVLDTDKVFKNFEKKFGDKIVSKVDGLSFDFGDYWFNIRKSNTEPLVRINIEGKDKNLVDEKMLEIKKFLGEN